VVEAESQIPGPGPQQSRSRGQRYADPSCDEFQEIATGGAAADVHAVEAADEWAFDFQVRGLGSASVLSAFGVDAFREHRYY
jgi:hypothetical protein